MKMSLNSWVEYVSIILLVFFAHVFTIIGYSSWYTGLSLLFGITTVHYFLNEEEDK